jgi:hypothetical protein
MKHWQPRPRGVVSKWFWRRFAFGLSLALLGAASWPTAGSAQTTPPVNVQQPTTGFLSGLHAVSAVASTIPPNLDVNPYALLVAPVSAGNIHQGDILVDNFNDRANYQGTGSTIVDIGPQGQLGMFAQIPRDLPNCPGGVGLSTAMTMLQSGWVIVGSTPSKDGTPATSGAGCLIVLDPTGQVVTTFSDPMIDGPWDIATVDSGSTATLFLTNTMNNLGAVGQEVDNGTVLRINLAVGASGPTITNETVIGSGFPEEADAGTFVDGPTGVALGTDGTLYVADRLGNRIAAIPQAATRTDSAGTGTTLTQAGLLNGPLTLITAPTGNLLVANALNGTMVEVTPAGDQLGNVWLDDDEAQSPPGSGDLFGVALSGDQKGVLFVKDDTNTLGLLH